MGEGEGENPNGFPVSTACISEVTVDHAEGTIENPVGTTVHFSPPLLHQLYLRDDRLTTSAVNYPNLERQSCLHSIKHPASFY